MSRAARPRRPGEGGATLGPPAVSGTRLKIVGGGAVSGAVTISEDLRPAVAVVPAQATALPALTAVAAPIPAPCGSPGTDTTTRVRDAVAALRRALDDGTVHQHRRGGIPESWTALGVEVVRAWAAGLDVEAQHRACRTCGPQAA